MELCRTNLVSNAIKYSDPRKAERWIEIRAHIDDVSGHSDGEIIVQVVDNGLGVPVNERQQLFQRFFPRSHVQGLKGRILLA